MEEGEYGTGEGERKSGHVLAKGRDWVYVYGMRGGEKEEKTWSMGLGRRLTTECLCWPEIIFLIGKCDEVHPSVASN